LAAGFAACLAGACFASGFLAAGFAACLAGAGLAGACFASAFLAAAGLVVCSTAVSTAWWVALAWAARASTVVPPVAAERRESSWTLAPVAASKARAPDWPEVDCEPLCTVFAASPAAWDQGAEPTAKPAAPSTPAAAAEAAMIESRECLLVMPAVARLAELMELDMRAWIRECKSKPLVRRLDQEALRFHPQFCRPVRCTVTTAGAWTLMRVRATCCRGATIARLGA
jgi:hypothetical protein